MKPLKDRLESLIDDYHFHILQAKDKEMVTVINEFLKIFKKGYESLKTNLLEFAYIEEALISNKIFEQISIEITDISESKYLKSDLPGKKYAPDAYVLTVSGQEFYTGKEFEYEIVFEPDLSHIAIKTDQDVFIYNAYYDYVIENTYSDTEINLLFDVFTAVAIEFNSFKSNVVRLEDFRK